MAKPNPDPGVTVTKIARPWIDPSPSGTPFKPQPRPRREPFAVVPERAKMVVPAGVTVWTSWYWADGSCSKVFKRVGPCVIEQPHAAITGSFVVGMEALDLAGQTAPKQDKAGQTGTKRRRKAKEST